MIAHKILGTISMMGLLVFVSVNSAISEELTPFRLPSDRAPRANHSELTPYRLPSETNPRVNPSELTPYRFPSESQHESQTNSKAVEDYYSEFAFKVEKLKTDEKRELLKHFKAKKRQSTSTDEFKHYSQLVVIVKESIDDSLESAVKEVVKGKVKVTTPAKDEDTKVTDHTRGKSKENEESKKTNTQATAPK